MTFWCPSIEAIVAFDLQMASATVANIRENLSYNTMTIEVVSYHNMRRQEIMDDDDEGVEVGVDFRRMIKASDRSDFIGFCARVSRNSQSKTSSLW